MKKIELNSKRISKKTVTQILKNIEKITGIVCDEEILSIGDLENFCFKNQINSQEFYYAI